MGEPMTEERLKEIEARAAEHVRNAREASPGVWTDAETLAGEDVSVLVDEVRRLRSEFIRFAEALANCENVDDMEGELAAMLKQEGVIGASEWSDLPDLCRKLGAIRKASPYPAVTP